MAARAEGMRRGNLDGFSLVEALVAVALSGIILTLVTTVFFAQNRFYDDMSRRSQLNETLRSVGELVTSDVRAVAVGGVQVAEEDRLVLRLPWVIGTACGSAGPYRHSYFPFGDRLPSEDEVQGWARRDPDGTWFHVPATWDELDGGSADLASCEAIGADLSGPASDFIRLNLTASGNAPVSPGDLIMLFSEIELRFGPSLLRPGERALHRGVRESPLIEFATGVTGASRFEYRVGGAFEAEVTGADRDDIDAVRLVIEAIPGGPGGAGDEAGARGWSLDIPFRNVTR